MRVDHLVPAEVRALVDRIRAEQGRLDVLVNDIWGGEKLFEWNKTVWEHDLDNGLRLLRLGIDTHLITAHFALPLFGEVHFPSAFFFDLGVFSLVVGATGLILIALAHQSTRGHRPPPER